ncbi:MAG: DegT/DnrJ/EryC1/StrS family aminotransferase [Deltaproteobacteria bacterium]|nr:DegT/DnrJ/EryC1/StrS family aminotransferase [Deltaproteobacteria bacterium]
MELHDLALYGGRKTREAPLPPRRLFGEAELAMVKAVFEESWAEGVDFGFQGTYEDEYCRKFSELQGGGFADAVSSGTAAVYLALRSLGPEPGDEVVVSPVTDPGSVAPALLLGLTPVVADARPGGYNVGPAEFEASLTEHTTAAVLTHSGGVPLDLDPILEIARSRGVALVEDCSQAHGATYRGRKVGTFGDVAAFSTMFSKAHATGGCGGVVYTRDEERYWLLRSLADRGKPFRADDFNPKDPRSFLWPTLNFNQNELACAIGISTLGRLERIVEQRRTLAAKLSEGLRACVAVAPAPSLPAHSEGSPFFYTAEVDTGKLTVPKEEFARAVAAEGVWINPNYTYVVSEWPWLRRYVGSVADTPNAAAYRARTFNILFHERFGDEEIEDIVSAVRKVESVYCRT